MRKLFVVAVILAFASSPAFALGIGARAMGMGGAHTALARDITAAYWNPAGLIHANLLVGDGLVSAGYDGNIDYNKLFESLGNIEEFVMDNWEDDIDFVSDASGIAGGSARGIGISYIPAAAAIAVKPPAPTGSTPPVLFNGAYKNAIAVTFGGKMDALPFPMPLVSPISIGANLKYLNGEYWGLTHAGGGITVPVELSHATGNGVGVDLGAQIDVLPNVTVGLALRDVIADFQWTGSVDTYDGISLDGELGNLTGSEDFEMSERVPTHVVLGGAVTLPMVAVLAADIDHYTVEDDGSKTNVHLGVESGFPLGIFVPRVGYYTEDGGDSSKTTAGLSVGLGPAHLDSAFGWDSSDPQDKFWMFAASFAL